MSTQSITKLNSTELSLYDIKIEDQDFEYINYCANDLQNIQKFACKYDEESFIKYICNINYCYKPICQSCDQHYEDVHDDEEIENIKESLTSKYLLKDFVNNIGKLCNDASIIEKILVIDSLTSAEKIQKVKESVLKKVGQFFEQLLGIKNSIKHLNAFKKIRRFMELRENFRLGLEKGFDSQFLKKARKILRKTKFFKNLLVNLNKAKYKLFQKFSDIEEAPFLDKTELAKSFKLDTYDEQILSQKIQTRLMLSNGLFPKDNFTLLKLAERNLIDSKEQGIVNTKIMVEREIQTDDIYYFSSIDFEDNNIQKLYQNIRQKNYDYLFQDTESTIQKIQSNLQRNEEFLDELKFFKFPTFNDTLNLDPELSFQEYYDKTFKSLIKKDIEDKNNTYFMKIPFVISFLELNTYKLCQYNLNCEQKSQKIKTYNLSQCISQIPKYFKSITICKNQHLDQQPYFLLIGGQDNQNKVSDQILLFENSQQKFVKVANLKTPRRDFEISFDGRSIYVIGGHNGSRSINDCEKISLPDNLSTIQKYEVEKIPNMNHSLSFCACTFFTKNLKDVIFKFGGFNDYEEVNIIEMYDIFTQQWKSLECDNIPKFSQGSCIQVDNDRILLYIGHSEESIQSNAILIKVDDDFNLQFEKKIFMPKESPFNPFNITCFGQNKDKEIYICSRFYDEESKKGKIKFYNLEIKSKQELF